MRCTRLLCAAGALVGATACGSPTVTLATDKPIEIKIDLYHEVRVRVDRDVDELIESEERPVRTRGVEASDDELVAAAKARDAIGEQADGYLGLHAASPESADRALVARVNARRQQTYRSLAQEHGAPIDEVEKAAGANRIEETAVGDWVRTPAGQWIEKSGATQVVVRDDGA
jgi:uncharacterized protein YdbL (DUF1318 family)